MEVLIQAAWGYCCALAVLLFGRLLCPRRRDGRSALSHGGCLALGCAVLSPLSAVFGWLGDAGLWALWAAAALAGLAGLGIKRPALIDAVAVPTRYRRAWLAFAAATGASAGFVALSPLAASANYDLLSYHLPLARGFATALTGEWAAGFYALMPMGAPSIHAPASLLGETSAGLAAINAAAALGMASCAYRLAAWAGARRVGRLAAALLVLLYPELQRTVYQHLSDPLTALALLAAVEAIVAALARSGRAAGAWRLGAMAGGLLAFAVATKLSALGIAVAPVLVVFLAAVAVRRGRGWPVMAAACLALLLALAPWAAHASLLSPVESRSFLPGLTAWTPQQTKLVRITHRPRTPVEVTYWIGLGRRLGFEGFGIGQPAWAPPISVMLLAACGCLTARRFALGRILLGVAMLGYLAHSLIGTAPTRFLLGSWALLAVAGARWMLAGPPLGRLRVALRSVVFGLLLLQVAFNAFVDVPAMPYATSAQGNREALAGQLGPAYLDAVQTAHLAAGEGRIAVLYDARTALFQQGAKAPLISTVWDVPPWAAALRDSRAAGADPEARARAVAAALRGKGASVVFINDVELSRLLDFYAQVPSRLAGQRNDGTLSPRLAEALALFPPIQLARLDAGDRATLAAFQRLAAEHAVWRQQFGPGALIVVAPLEAMAQK